jgi:2-phosphosulfolactate phosphatase
LAAKLFYENRAEDSYEILRQSRVGTNLQNYHYDEDLLFVSQKGVLPLILTLEEKRLISIKKEKVANKREE